jgi:GntR family transcriptional regulator, transcriptional repressor for pyruvate dehydrogenase complex
MSVDNPGKQISVHAMLESIGAKNGSRVAQTASALADLSLAGVAGEFLGAEDDLLARLGVSRPTLRQAAKMVESDKLITVRRGAKGGFYAARPDATDAIRAPARYLQVNGATIADVQAVAAPISEATAAAAAKCLDSLLRGRLAVFRDRIDSNDSVVDMVRSETDLARLLAEMSGNPAARLFIEISHTFGRNERHLRFYQDAEDRQRARSLQRGLCDAVLANDPDIARLMMQRRSALIVEWLAREQGARS